MACERQRERPAASLTEGWHNGLTERLGQKRKPLKRQGHGRADSDLCDSA